MPHPNSRYDAFGENIGGTGAVSNKYLFAGEQYDSNLGDYYLRTRYYDADSGRFTRRDSYEGKLSEPLTLHKYIYANDNPITFVDPSGKFSLLEVSAQSAVLGALTGAAINGSLAAVSGFVNGDFSMQKVAEASAKGALAGGIFGLTAGLAGPALGALGIAGRTAGVLTGAVSGLTSNLGIQSLNLATGAQEEFQVESLLISAAWGGVFGALVFRPANAPQQQIAHWSGTGNRAFQEGEKYWVMSSGSYRSYWLAGIIRRYAYGNRQVTVVPANKLSYPEGLEAFKGLLGQRMYTP